MTMRSLLAMVPPDRSVEPLCSRESRERENTHRLIKYDDTTEAYHVLVAMSTGEENVLRWDEDDPYPDDVEEVYEPSAAAAAGAVQATAGTVADTADSNYIPPPQKKTKKKHPPGEMTIISDVNKKLRASITVQVYHRKLHLIPSGSMSAPWTAFTQDLFHGEINRNGEYIPGPLSSYAMWKGGRPESKLREMFYAGVDKDALGYVEKKRSGEEPTELERLAYTILKERKQYGLLDYGKKVKNTEEETKKRENETEEVLLGMRCRRKARKRQKKQKKYEDQNQQQGETYRTKYREALAGMSGKTMPVEPAELVELVETLEDEDGLEELTIQGPKRITPSAAERRSRAAAERTLAESAAKDSKKIKYKPGEKPKIPKHEDHQPKHDALFQGTQAEAVVIAEALKDVTTSLNSHSVESPETKRRREISELSSILKDLIQEHRDRVSAGLSTDQIDTQLSVIEAERTKLIERRNASHSEAAVNLGSQMNDQS